MTTESDNKNYRAQQFRATRAQHNLEAAEDYCELILDLIESSGSARTGEIASCLGVSHVTALRTIQRIQKEGYVATSRGKPVELTSKGKELAVFARKRHKIMVDLFTFLGVPRKTAELDAEGAEHHISKVTLKKITKFLESKELEDR